MKNEENVMPKIERVSEDKTDVVQNLPMPPLEFIVKQIEFDIDPNGLRIFDANGRPRFFAHPYLRRAKVEFHSDRKAGVITFSSLLPVEALQILNGPYQPGVVNGDPISVSLEYDKVSTFIQAYHMVEALQYQISS